MASKGTQKATESVRVVVRCRPLNSKETSMNCKSIVEMDGKTGQVRLHPPKGSADNSPKSFTFDSCYDSKYCNLFKHNSDTSPWSKQFTNPCHPSNYYQAILCPHPLRNIIYCSLQENVFVETAQPIVDSVLEGYNGTIFAYGQTGTGKTFTMEGISEPKELRGIIPRSFQYIFESIDEESSTKKKHLVRASYLEIYNEEIRDLLGNDPLKKLDLKENPDSGVYVKDLSGFVVKSKLEIEGLMARGHKNRTVWVGYTMMNAESSRSHSIFTILIESSEASPADGKDLIKQGKLNLVDLAGSERANKTGATGERLKEGCKINLSLSALGNVISALVDGKSQHIPYRDSKLTRLLQDSLGGNARTVMIANMGPAEYNYDETLSTLRYANRAKNIKNKPKINEDPKDTLLREFQQEIEKLRTQLAEMTTKASAQPPSPHEPTSPSSPMGIEPSAPKDGNPRPSSARHRSRNKAAIQEASPEEPRVEVKYVVDESLIQELQQKSQEEIKALMDQKNMAEEDRQKIQSELAQRHAALEQERSMRENLQKKLKELEENLIEGGVHVMDKVKLQEKELQRAKLLMIEKQKEEEKLKKELEEKEEARLMAQENYASIQEEVESKTKKLKKAMVKIQNMAAEMKEQQEIFTQEREELTDGLRSVTNELALARLIIDFFVPSEEAEKIKRKAIWDDEKSEWRIPQLEKTGIQHIPRPTLSRRAQMLSTGSLRRKQNDFNRMSSTLDYPDKTTRDSKYPHQPTSLEEARILAGVEPIPIPSETFSLVYHSYNQPDYGQVRVSDGMLSERQESSRGERRARPSSASRSRPSSSAGSASLNQTVPSTSHSGGLNSSARPSSARRSPSRLMLVSEAPRTLIDDEPDPAPAYPTARGLVRKN